LFDYVYADIKPDVLLGSVTGGTDIIACFAGNNVSLPVYRGEIQSLHLGCAVESWNDDGMLAELLCFVVQVVNSVRCYNDIALLYHPNLTSLTPLFKGSVSFSSTVIPPNTTD